MKSLLSAGAIGVALLMTGVAANAAVSNQDHVFATEAAQGGMAEVQAAHMALRKSTNPSVDAFARRMIHDHGMANEKLATIAQAQGLTPPAHIDEMDQMMADHLSTLSGKAFDDAYIKGQVIAHKRTIALFKKEATEGSNPQLVSFARKTLPTLDDHLMMADTDHAKMM